MDQPRLQPASLSRCPPQSRLGVFLPKPHGSVSGSSTLRHCGQEGRVLVLGLQLGEVDGVTHENGHDLGKDGLRHLETAPEQDTPAALAEPPPFLVPLPHSLVPADRKATSAHRGPGCPLSLPATFCVLVKISKIIHKSKCMGRGAGRASLSAGSPAPIVILGLASAEQDSRAQAHFMWEGGKASA